MAYDVYLLLNLLESTQQIILYGAALHRDNLVHPSSIPKYKVPQFVCLKYRGVLSHMVTPSSHPFEIGIFYKSSIWGIPHLWKPQLVGCLSPSNGGLSPSNPIIASVSEVPNHPFGGTHIYGNPHINIERSIVGARPSSTCFTPKSANPSERGDTRLNIDMS